MGYSGMGIHDSNVRLRFLSFIFLGIIAFGAVLYWRTALLDSQEYVEFPKSQQMLGSRNRDDSVMRSRNFQLETEETSPTIN